MTDLDRKKLLDKVAIGHVVADWGIFRDTCRWEELRGTYGANGMMSVSWFEGSADDFVNGCKRMSSATPDPMVTHHVISNGHVEVAGDHAVADTRVTILVRLQVDGVLCDVTIIGRFFDLFERAEDGWKIRRREVVYEKDSIAPVDPNERLIVDTEKLATFPEAQRWTGYFLGQRGVALRPDLPIPGSPTLTMLVEGGRAWLAAGAPR